MNLKITLILPTHGQFDYARACLRSWFSSGEQDADLSCVVVDDASPNWDDDWHASANTQPLRVHRFDSHGQLTRSLNKGFEMAKEFNPDFVVAGNSDLLFPAGWWRSLCDALTSELDFAGPLSNAPGLTNPDQHVRRWHFTYTPSDAPDEINTTNRLLQGWYKGQTSPGPINGFCMMAKTSTWHRFAYGDTVFPTSIHSLGFAKNPSPLMAGQEEWLLQQCKSRQGRLGIVPGSFVFHYRSVTRGKEFIKGDSYRGPIHSAWCT